MNNTTTQTLNQNKMGKQLTALEELEHEVSNLVVTTKEYVIILINQAKAKERVQKAEEYLKGFNDGKEFKKKLDELTFGSNKQIMSTDIPITNKDKEELMEILNRMQRNLTFKSE